ncbi:uncharacterized membrane protein At3g27390-like [Telopea speciosissima]|uniref:uncharacterized membrane protein At3g27390-like n=1 Tax=Telopea speciosissima TaxID=54955 RepID=UPI001CC3B9CA|nr:uncharacterized membrane protein At3g27390-like [Telopea speciosissima]XP_043726151.1 uncharacterized membrane protein At3g27390-like [Telopea speciosissima]
MEPPRGFLASLWSFLRFLPFFIGLLLLGIIKGVIFFPLIFLIISIGNSAIILGLWPVHSVWTYCCIARAKQLGPVLKIALCLCISVILILWPLVGIVGSILAGAVYGFLAPLIATFEAVGEGKTDVFRHCIIDGTLSSVERSCTVVRDFNDVCFHSYFSVMDDLRLQEPPNGKPYEIRLLYIPGALLAGLLGIIVDMPVVTLLALYKSPYMLLKGWHRLFHDLIGREGPFLETICVPFAGLAILLWPLAVTGAILGSMVSSVFLGAYSAVVAHQESSIWLGLCYIISSLSIYDEYSNDILDMPEGSCFPKLQYRKKGTLSRISSRATSFSRPNSFRNPPSRLPSFKNSMIELKSVELLDGLFVECKKNGELLVAEGLIRPEDIEDSKSSTGGTGVLSIGLPAYCILLALLRSANANVEGILLSDNVTEITTTNRPKESFFEWFFNPLLILKDQIKAKNLSEAEENYLRKIVLLSCQPDRLKILNLTPPETEQKHAELDAFARRLQGITKTISRYPTFRRRFVSLVRCLSHELAMKNSDGQLTNGPRAAIRTRSGLVRMFSQNSFGSRTNHQGADMD